MHQINNDKCKKYIEELDDRSYTTENNFVMETRLLRSPVLENNLQTLIQKDLNTPSPLQKEPMVRFFYHTFQTILRRKKINFFFVINLFFRNIFFQISKIFFEHTFQTILRRIFFYKNFFLNVRKCCQFFLLW